VSVYYKEQLCVNYVVQNHEYNYSLTLWLTCCWNVKTLPSKSTHLCLFLHVI